MGLWRRLFRRSKHDKLQQNVQTQAESIPNPPFYADRYSPGRSETTLPINRPYNPAWSTGAQQSSPELVHNPHSQPMRYPYTSDQTRPTAYIPGLPTHPKPLPFKGPVQTPRPLQPMGGPRAHNRENVPTLPNQGIPSTDMVFKGPSGGAVYRTTSRRDKRLSAQFPDTPVQTTPLDSSTAKPYPSQTSPVVESYAESFLPQSAKQRRQSMIISPETYTIYEAHDPHSLPHQRSDSGLQTSSYDSNGTQNIPYRQSTSGPLKTLRQNDSYKPATTAIVKIDTDDESVDEEFFPESNRHSTSSELTGPLSATDALARLLEINHNDRFSGISKPPFWYIKEPEDFPVGDPKHLCGTCRHINIALLYSQRSSRILPPASEYVQLGTLVEMIAKMNDCGLCHFIMRLIAREVATKKLGPQFTLTEMSTEFFTKYLAVEANRWEEYSLFPIQFETRYDEYALYICRGQPPDPSSLSNPRVTMPGDLLGFREVHSCCRRPNTGRLVRNKTSMDTDWIKEMLKLCDERSSGWSGFNSTLVNIRVIDVHRLCVVELKEAVRYLTLSYVWGKGIVQAQLTSQNMYQMQRPNGLLHFWDSIPKTIHDAIRLTREIGENFLWVDALCIVQNDPGDKARQIRHMGSIYQGSVLTIIAACGTNATYGLPGVGPDSRTVNQMIGLAGKSLLCNILDKDDDEKVSLEWDTRAWTMQENVLSQRKLIITDQCYKFWCSHTSSTEDVHCRHGYWPVGHEYQTFFFFNNDNSDFIVPKARSSNFDTYASMVSDYTKRNMTDINDAENAIRGCLEAIQGMFFGSFIYGLPDSEIEFALLWCPIGPTVRRLDPKTRVPLFPSWSYLGWIGPAAYPWSQERQFPLTARECDVRWRDARRNEWVDFSTATFRPHPRTWKRLEDDPFNWESTVYPGSRFCNPVSDGHVRPFISRDANNQHPHRIGIETMIASFRLSGVSFKRPEKYNTNFNINYMHVLDAKGFRVGSVYTPGPKSFDNEQQGPFSNRHAFREFIVLSRASIHSDPRIGYDSLSQGSLVEKWFRTPPRAPTRGWSMNPMSSGFVHPKGMFDTRVYDENVPYCLFNVLMIEWSGHRDVAFRVTNGRIHIDAFREAQPKVGRIFLE